MSFEDKPDYDLLRQLFRSSFEELGYKNDSIFDWNVRWLAHNNKLKSNESVIFNCDGIQNDEADRVNEKNSTKSNNSELKVDDLKPN